MAQSAQIKTWRVKPEAILNWLLMNPEEPMARCAHEFGVTQAWLSSIVNSDLFQEKLRQRQEEMFQGMVMPTVKDKLAGVADRAVERLGEKVDSPDATGEFLLRVADKALGRLGYGSGSGGSSGGPSNQTNVQQNFYFADRDMLSAAREKMEAVRTQGGNPEPAKLADKATEDFDNFLVDPIDVPSTG